MAGPSGPRKAKQERNIAAGTSSGSGQPELRYLAVGRIVRAHGVRGEVSMTVLTDFPERFENTAWLHLGNEFEAKAFRLERYRWHKKNLLLTLAGVTTRSQAEQLKGQLVQVPIEDAVPLPEGNYYVYQLIGLEVITIQGDRLGYITEILETGANDVYVVKGNSQQEVLIPSTPDVVKSINVEKGQLTVELIDGLI